MSGQLSSACCSALKISRQFLDQLLAECAPRDFGVRFWDGSRLSPSPNQPERFTLVVEHPGALRNCFMPSKPLRLVEAYLFGSLDVEGDLQAFWQFMQSLYNGVPAAALSRARIEAALAELPDEALPLTGRRAARLEGEVHGPARDKQAIASHYAVSNDFYALWLDSRMLYSCAYFKHAENDIGTAQRDKLDHICRKLRLQPGDRLLDIGCGWGGLAVHAVQHYGARVVGVTLSEPQARFARELVEKLGLTDRCEIRFIDYRDLHEPESFDKICSVGMAEHVGAAQYPTYFQQAWNLLKPGGTFLNHAIGEHPGFPMPAGSTFIFVYIFPDGQLTPIPVVAAAAEAVGFEVRDVENLREHYRMTCNHWLRRLEARAAEAIALTDEPTYRTWRLYLAFSEYTFRTGKTNIYQTLLSKPVHGQSQLPLTRDDWYLK